MTAFAQTAPESSPSFLTTELKSPKIDMLAAVQKVAALTRKSPRSVAFALLRSAIGRHRVLPEEYFGLGIWRTTLTNEERAAFVSHARIRALAKTLIGPRYHDASSMMNDKYSTGLVLTANGFDNPQPLAAFSTDRAFGRLRTLTTAAELAAYFADPSRPAVFGKPVNGSRALGVSPILAVLPGADSVGLGQGKTAPIAALSQEIASNYSRGWLMQELIEQSADVIDLAGTSVSSLRVVTLWEDDGPQPLYAAWRLVAKGATNDALVSGPRVLTKIDLASGKVVKARVGDFLNGRDVTHSPTNPDRPLVGYQIPDWPEVLRICREAHRLFPGHAVIGWDIALSSRGPLVQEVNATPLHDIYHKSHDSGFFAADFLARFANAKQLLDARIARYGEIVRFAGTKKTTAP